ncbi:AraC family transcriptional regulator [Bacillus solitudinis]|uniref:AraC family transcriptional regulator n=1 Tax=Bacillus solitudinis TaxID=2014074 RepID=UPI000C246FF6|nr:AraC family transcriptional regulator [Bacillus solitudinis]
MNKKRYVFSSLERNLPLFVESIGYNPLEHDFSRPDGYPYFHWLQTLDGKGKFNYESGKTEFLTNGNAVLVTPFTPHTYSAASEKWSTIYITFGGVAVNQILDALELNRSAYFTEIENSPISGIAFEMLTKIERESEFSRLDLSSDLYHFLITLKKYGKSINQVSLSQNYDKLRPVVTWLEEMYYQDIGLPEMAQKAMMSAQHLNTLFHDTFRVSPYSFLIQLRIRESKRIMVSDPVISLKEVSKQVGFNDVSHFVATFRKKEGITPKKYRDLHLSSE